MPADATDSALVAKRLEAVTREIYTIHEEVAAARQVKEFHGDRLKRAFSVLVVEFQKQEMSVAGAEHAARATDTWGAALNDMGEQYKSALKVIEKHDALRTRFEALRSLLSLHKETLRQI